MTAESDAASTIMVVMGVSGCGKTTIGKALAARLGWVYKEGDDFHTAHNVEKIRAGIPLDDADRSPWLTAIAAWMDAQAAAGHCGVIGCSALKRGYRDFLRAGRPQVWFVYLRAAREELECRVATRHHPYMPASLLDSQLAALEEPAGDEPDCVTADANGDVGSTVDAILRMLLAQGIVDASPSH
ncbi:MAG: gluconokinase [Rhodanobacteraceae bacterium]